MSNEKESEVNGDEMAPYRRFWGRDGAGQEINPESVKKAVASWAELCAVRLRPARLRFHGEGNY
jgi:hypothetical protein